MPSYYTYLIASLPMLHFGKPPPFSSEQFLERCQGLVPESDLGLLKAAVREPAYAYKRAQPFLKRWSAFDIELRNELARLRAARKKIDAAKYQRQDGSASLSVAHTALAAFRNPSIIEAEMLLDLERWRFLDEACAGHYFDLDILLSYGLKLTLLEKWGRVEAADKMRVLEATIERL